LIDRKRVFDYKKFLADNEDRKKINNKKEILKNNWGSKKNQVFDLLHFSDWTGSG
jgi:hypothetical protein